MDERWNDKWDDTEEADIDGAYLFRMRAVIERIIAYTRKHPLNISPELAKIGEVAERVAFDEDWGWWERPS